MFFSWKLTICLLDLRDSSICFHSEDLIGDKGLKWLDVFDHVKAVPAHEPANGQHKQFNQKPFVQPGESVDLWSFLHSFYACSTFAVFVWVIDGNLTVDHWLNDHNPSSWHQTYQQKCQTEVVEGWIIIIQTFLLTTFEVFLETWRHYFFLLCILIS